LPPPQQQRQLQQAVSGLPAASAEASEHPPPLEPVDIKEEEMEGGAVDSSDSEEERRGMASSSATDESYVPSDHASEGGETITRQVHGHEWACRAVVGQDALFQDSVFLASGRIAHACGPLCCLPCCR
jgi:hypothetical protein